MRWEECSAACLAQAAKEIGVCILALGVLEKHGDHLPLGTDMYIARGLACEAAKIEEAVVFPPFYFGQIYEARCFPGTITLEPNLLLSLFLNVLDEIARNGFKKIIVSNQHGGNEGFLKFLAMALLAKKKDYSVYFYTQQSPELSTFIHKHMETTLLGHACECETSRMLYYRPDLVDLTKCNGEVPLLHRLDDIPMLHTGLSWYAKVPEHVIGDPSKATLAKGEALETMEAKLFAAFIRAVKSDTELSKLQEEFFSKTNE